MVYAEELRRIRKRIVEIVSRVKEGHIPSSFSVLEILFAIYTDIGENDRFFLSKGHASIGLYAILEHFGILKKEEVDTFCEYDSFLGGHPHRKEPYIMCSSGSLGHGFPIAAGYALAKKIKGEEGRVFCLVGDGECNEGSIWETAMYADQLKLNNLVCIVDDNSSQTRAMNSRDLNLKFQNFGWEVRKVYGHDMTMVREGLSESEKPLCLIAYTIKGYGVEAIEDDMFSWHHRAPTKEECESFIKEIGT